MRLNKFESPQIENSFEKIEGEKETKETIFSKDVLTQLDNLGITSEMVKGEVLDIGAGDAEFARDFSGKEDVNITSIDSTVTKENMDKVVNLDARDLPYKDNSYDMVVSHASMPHNFKDMYSPEFPDISKAAIMGSVSSVFHEIVRVLKPGKEAYLAPVLIAENWESQKVIKEVILKVMDNIRDEGVGIEFEFLRKIINPDNQEEQEEYRIIIKKQDEKE